jgi:anti-sigma regulatory factor (Ser/Thr protein kinase)
MQLSSRSYKHVIVTPVRPVGRKWSTLSFASTLYLVPVLDLLLAEVPQIWQPELRLGLQEALVNAAKHGNQLDPSKQVTIRFSAVTHNYWWVISDQGGEAGNNCADRLDDPTPCQELECGRGFYILRQVFDRVHWSPDSHQLDLYKRIDKFTKPSIF